MILTKNQIYGWLAIVFFFLSLIATCLSESYSDILVRKDYPLGLCLAWTFESICQFVFCIAFFNIFINYKPLKLSFAWAMDLCGLCVFFSIFGDPYAFKQDKILSYGSTTFVFGLQCLYWFKYKEKIDKLVRKYIVNPFHISIFWLGTIIHKFFRKSK